jgi:hypothetical protein
VTDQDPRPLPLDLGDEEAARGFFAVEQGSDVPPYSQASDAEDRALALTRDYLAALRGLGLTARQGRSLLDRVLEERSLAPGGEDD